MRRIRIPVVGPHTSLHEFPRPMRAEGSLAVPAQYAGGQQAQFMGARGWFRGVAVERDRRGRITNKRLVRAARQGMVLA